MNALAAVVLTLALAAAVPAQAATSSLKVLELTGGTLTVGERELKPGQKIPGGPSARLSRGARLVLGAGPWGKLLLHGPAVFATSDEDDGLNLKAGGVLAVLRPVKGRAFSVHTAAAAMSVRGTTFYTETRGQTSFYLCICDGTVDVETPSGAYKTTVSSERQHKPYLFQFNDDNGLQSEAEMVRHTDAEIEELSVGVKPVKPKP
jgi:hypothetical protein